METNDPQNQSPLDTATEIELPTGMELTPTSASPITQSRPSRIIVLAGPSDSGKTTLLTAIYEKFCRGPFAGTRFAGSQTLWAWEQRCHTLRVASGRTSPETERTKRAQEQHLLHLRLQNEVKPHRTTDVLLTDIDGERFSEAIQSTEESKKLTLVSRADHFVLCLDGKRLSDTRLRFAARDEGLTLLRAFIEAGMLGKASSVMVLFTKTDLLRQTPNVDKLLAEIEEEYTQKYGGSFGALRFHAVAAYPFQPAIGIDELVRRWMSETRVGQNLNETLDEKSVLQSERQINKFQDTVSHGY